MPTIILGIFFVANFESPRENLLWWVSLGYIECVLLKCSQFFLELKHINVLPDVLFALLSEDVRCEWEKHLKEILNSLCWSAAYISAADNRNLYFILHNVCKTK